MKKITAHFKDQFKYDAVQKTAVSVRDGVIEYYGHEIGMQPADRLFKVYRSPATIANAAVAMQGIPLTNDHVSVDMPVQNACGSVLTSHMIDLKSADMLSTVGVCNSIDVNNDQLGALAAGKRELSLGYTANLFEVPPENGYDFEQRDIAPHHLAIVDAGRCGSVCSFIDHKASEGIQDMTKGKKAKLNKVFTDADGAPSMTAIVEVINGLPDAVASLPIDQLQEVIPTLQGIVEANGGGDAVVDDEAEPKDDKATTDADPEAGAAGGEDKPKEQAATDEDGEDKKKPFGDAKSFKDAVAKQVAEHIEIVDRAKQFLPETYDFKNKSARQIMLDAVKTEHPKTKFNDSELNVAFKLLKKTESKYKNFGDKQRSSGKFTDHVKG